MKQAKLELNDWPRDGCQRSDFGEIVRGKYAKRAAHAANVALCERLKLADFATTDRRHFSAIRPSHRARLNLLPDP